MPQKHGGKSLANKKPKTAPKMQPQRAAGSKGGGRNAFLNAEELELLREFAEERRQSADEAKKKETARSVVKQLRKEGYELVTLDHRRSKQCSLGHCLFVIVVGL